MTVNSQSSGKNDPSSQSYHKTPEATGKTIGHVWFVPIRSLFFPHFHVVSFPFPFFLLFFFRFKIPDQRNSLWPQHGRWQQLSRDTNYKRLVEPWSNSYSYILFHVALRNSRWNDWWCTLANTPWCIGLLNGPYKVYEHSNSRGIRHEKFLWRRSPPSFTLSRRVLRAGTNTDSRPPSGQQSAVVFVSR